MYLDDYDHLRNFWMPLIAFSALLGVFLILLGISIAGLISAKRKRDENMRTNSK